MSQLSCNIKTGRLQCCLCRYAHGQLYIVAVALLPHPLWSAAQRQHPPDQLMIIAVSFWL